MAPAVGNTGIALPVCSGLWRAGSPPAPPALARTVVVQTSGPIRGEDCRTIRLVPSGVDKSGGGGGWFLEVLSRAVLGVHGLDMVS